MTHRQEVQRLLDAIGPIVRRHCEMKVGSGLLHVPITPAEMKELRSAFEPFSGADGEQARPEDSVELKARGRK